MSEGLNVNDVVRVTTSFTLANGTYRNFNSIMGVGSTPGVIDVVERIRVYADIDGVASDYPTTAPEFLWAEAAFSQSPRPSEIRLARWAQTATAAILHGASLTPAQRVITVFNAITNGGLQIVVDGTNRPLTGLNFSSATNLNAVASILQAALRSAGAANSTVVWNASTLRFDVTSGTTGPSSTLSYATPPAFGTDVSVTLGLSATLNSTGANADPPVPGMAAETALSCITTLSSLSGAWYAVDFVPLTPMSDAERIAVAGIIEADSRARIFGTTVQNTAAYDSTRSDDLGAILSDAGFERSLTQFSSTSPFAMASLLGRAATINFLGSNTTITFKFKQEPGITPEYLSEQQWATLQAKNYNVSAAYQNGASILQNGVMVSGQFIDNRIGADWLADYLQTNAFNLLVTLPKVPQTDDGMNLLVASFTQSCEQAVTNGLIAPGIWNGPSFGTVTNGKFLPLGFEIYAPLVASQSETDRAARKSVPFQIAVKLAGAVHSVDVAITINP